MIPTTAPPPVLTRAQELAHPALVEAVASLAPELRPPVRYHLGWTDANGLATPGGGGKGVRVALAVLSAEAVGAKGTVGVPGAVAVELVHNFSLLHDDLIDGDRERRHRETVWSLFGVSQAVIAGDALLSLAHEVLANAPSLGAFAAARRLAAATSAMIAGQAADIAAEGTPLPSLDACEAMERAKTGALLGAAASLGAVLAEAPAPVADALEAFGVELGLAFQAVDDLLGIWGDPERTGKPRWSDLRSAKASLPVAAALSAGRPESEELVRLLAGPRDDEGVLARAAELVERAGGRAYAGEAAEAHLGRALGLLETAPLTEPATEELAGLARFVVDRAY